MKKQEVWGLENSGGSLGEAAKVLGAFSESRRCVAVSQSLPSEPPATKRKDLALARSHKLQVCVSERSTKQSLPIPYCPQPPADTCCLPSLWIHLSWTYFI